VSIVVPVNDNFAATNDGYDESNVESRNGRGILAGLARHCCSWLGGPRTCIMIHLAAGVAHIMV
jgi:hypothetical protein